MILCVAANPAVDRLFEVEQLVPGTIHRPSQFVQVAGGKGLNVARSAVALGGHVQAAALLGGHAGRWIAERLGEEGVPLQACWAGAETRSALSVAGAAEGLTEFYERGGPVTAAEWTTFAELVGGLMPRAGWTTLSGSLPPGAPASGYADLLPRGRCALDADPAGVAAEAAVVKLNAVEASQATGIPVGDAAGAARAARALGDRFGGAVVVTRGAGGAVLSEPGGGPLEGRIDARGRYPVGSGDAFLAGLVVALDRGAGWAGALAAGLGAGAANAEQPGAGCLDRARAERLAGLAQLREM